MLALLFILSVGLFVVAYLVYGPFLDRTMKIDDKNKTPAETLNDNQDYVPTNPSVLLGHHFSSIAGAGPVVGPITAANLFGWLPAYIWVVIGSIFVGGVHDYTSIVASIRHKGLSIGEVVREWIGERGKKLFLIFTWLALVLVVAVFAELAAQTLSQESAVGFSSTCYVFLAILFGLAIYRMKMPLWLATVIAVPLLYLALIAGEYWPWLDQLFTVNISTWRLILLVYIFIASVLPVWVLLQPRDYLSSFLLYGSVIVGAIGMVFGKFDTTHLAAFKSFKAANGDLLWPILFVTVACGAISGFHSLVGSGTTSKQIRKESDAKMIGYGGMLLEGVVATIAIGTVIIWSGWAAPGSTFNPMGIYGAGLGRFAELIGIPAKLGTAFGLLALNSFILTSLDTATRLARYQLQELFNLKDKYVATVIGIVFAAYLIFFKSGNTPMWSIIWPIFGSANQLVAGLALLAVSVWLIRGLGKNATFTLIPFVFMTVTTIASLIILVYNKLTRTPPVYVLGITGIVLIILAVWLVYEAFVVLSKPAPPISAKGGAKAAKAR
ncbi:MAG: carbon starvation protein A [Firmicutes bacterium]|jgi:carbon starvation protein|nr:carbon starvation protein A [Bacillota bacterium]